MLLFCFTFNEMLQSSNFNVMLQSILFVLGCNDTSTLVGHFLSSPREREKRDVRDYYNRGDVKEDQGKKRNRNESEETKTFPSTLTCYKDSRPYPSVSQY